MRPVPVQPRSLTFAEQRAQATRGDLWPTFLAPPENPEPVWDDPWENAILLPDLDRPAI